MSVKRLTTLFIVALLFTGCVDWQELGDAEAPAYAPAFAFPLVRSTTTLQDILEDFEDANTIFVDETGLIHLRYRGDVISQTAERVTAVINESLPPIIPIPDTFLSFPFMPLGELSIDRMDLDAGQLIYYFENPDPEPVTVTLTLLNVRRGGEPLAIRETLPGYSGSGSRPAATNQDAPLSLASAQILAPNDSITIRYQALRPDGSRIRLANTVLQIRDIGYAYAEGDLGRIVIEGGPDTIDIELFEEYIGGDIYFADPSVTYYFENSFGIPARSVINTFQVITVDGQVLEVESPIRETGIDFPFPAMNEVGQIKFSSYTFDRTNSNIVDLLGAGPLAVIYDVDALANPEDFPGSRWFMTGLSYYNVQLEVDLPLYGQVDEFLAYDTLGIDLQAVGEDVEEAEFKVLIDNGIGLDAVIQAVFLDEAGVVLDSLVGGESIVATGAAVDSGGEVIRPQRTERLILFSGDRFRKLEAATTAVLKVCFSTNSNGNLPVKVRADQETQIGIGVKLKLNAE